MSEALPPRPSALVAGGPLPPLDARFGVARIERAELRRREGEPLAARVARHRPVLADGPAHPTISTLLTERFEARTLDAAGERVAFEHDGTTLRAQVRLAPGADYYGTGMPCGPLRRNGRATRLWNTDAWRYTPETPALYQSHPYVLALRADGSALGILADVFRAGLIAIHDDGVELAFEEEPYDVYLVEGAHPADVQRALAALAGTIELPPAWALGYHQCRWSYESADEVRALAAELRARGIPCDAIWLDIDHMDRHRVFTWHPERFADPEAMLAELHDQGFRAVAIADPGVADADDCEMAASGRAGAHFVLDARGEPARGRVWPGVCTWPDFTREETRAWWAGHAAHFVASGLDGLWIDMNEPAVQRAPAKTLPHHAQHRGLGGGSHRRFHNLYGRLMAEATRAGLLRAHPERRPFVLTRSNHLGGARFAACWTGDNQSRWEDLAWSLPMVLNLGISGQPFAGPDIGGFDADPDAEQFARWFQLGAWMPFCRGHASKETCRKEPWAFGAEIEEIVRAALEQRMRLLPTIYTLFREASVSGLPVMRPVFHADPDDPALRAIDDAFLLGEDLLVAPALAPGVVEREVVLPRHAGGGWYAYTDGAHLDSGTHVVAAPLARCPAFARAGAIVVEGPGGTTAQAALAGPLHQRVFPDAAGHARGRVYQDAGEGHAHRAGAFRELSIEARATIGQLTLELNATGAHRPPGRALRVTLHERDGARRSWACEEAPRLDLPRG